MGNLNKFEKNEQNVRVRCDQDVGNFLKGMGFIYREAKKSH